MKGARRKVGFFHGSVAEGIRTTNASGIWPPENRKGLLAKSNFDLAQRSNPSPPAKHYHNRNDFSWGAYLFGILFK